MYQRLSDLPGVGEIRYMTHLACADDRDDPATRRPGPATSRPARRRTRRASGRLANSAAHAGLARGPRRPGASRYHALMAASPFIRPRRGARSCARP
ncbi:MAG: hypothetical protein U5L11_11385 [Arhodomonas sp.]|nr:hypothetical protein [Arhodomonas sp.]